MRLTTSAVWSTHLWNHWPDPEKQLSKIRIGVWGCNIMIWYLYILQNDHHNTHSQTHAQEGETVPEAHSENYPFNGLYLESKENVPWETSLWTCWASTTHKGRNHHHLRAHPPQAGDETPRSWFSWQDYCGGQQPRLPTKPNWMEEGLEHCPSLTSSFPESLRRGNQVHIPSGKPTALWYCEVTRE